MLIFFRLKCKSSKHTLFVFNCVLCYLGIWHDTYTVNYLSSAYVYLYRNYTCMLDSCTLKELTQLCFSFHLDKMLTVRQGLSKIKYFFLENRFVMCKLVQLLYTYLGAHAHNF